MFRPSPVLAAATLLASALPTSGAVIHIVPPAPLIPPRDGTGTESVLLDIDGDGNGDLEFFNDTRNVDVSTLARSRILATADERLRVAAVPTGAFIGATAPSQTQWTESFFLDPPFDFAELKPIFIDCAGAGGQVFCGGEFVGITAFAGVEFPIGGNTHYGWVRITAGSMSTGILIHDWAYESAPGVPIAAGAIPEPAAAVLAAAGTFGLLRRRTR